MQRGYEEFPDRFRSFFSRRWRDQKKKILWKWYDLT